VHLRRGVDLVARDKGGEWKLLGGQIWLNLLRFIPT
jgi:hypothetical protein